jgi:hypothetical protein
MAGMSEDDDDGDDLDEEEEDEDADEEDDCRTLSTDGPPGMCIHFAVDFSWNGGHRNDYVRVWGEGDQEPGDPAPVLSVETPSWGTWTLRLNNELYSAAISLECAQEVWDALIAKGWEPEDGDREF